MTSTLSAYLQISNNTAKWQSLTAKEPLVKGATDYYQKNIGSVKKPSDLVNNYRLFTYVMNAFGLGDMTYAKAMVQKVLEQGVNNQDNIVYKLNNPNLLALAKTFNFAVDGASTTSSDAVKTGVVNNYIQQAMQKEQGQTNPGLQLALYFQQRAPSIKNAYQILADKSLTTVVQTALGISQYTSYQPIDTQAKYISSRLNFDDFKDPQKLQKFIQKFSVLYDVNNTSAASSSGGVSTNLLSSIQGLRLGGY